MNEPLSPVLCQGNWSFANSLGLLILRLALGWVFIYAGSQKLFGFFGGAGMMEQFIRGLEQMHMPVLSATAWAYIAACGEFFGGLFVFVGLLTRLAALPIIVTMLVAIAKVHGPNGFSGYFDAAKGYQIGYQLNFVLIGMAVALVLTGAGLVSLDALLFKRSLWSHGPQPLEQPAARS